MKKILLALALLLAPSVASAQCNGVFSAGTVCGNNGVVAAPPKAINPGAVGPLYIIPTTDPDYTRSWLRSVAPLNGTIFFDNAITIQNNSFGDGVTSFNGNAAFRFADNFGVERGAIGYSHVNGNGNPPNTGYFPNTLYNEIGNVFTNDAFDTNFAVINTHGATALNFPATTYELIRAEGATGKIISEDHTGVVAFNFDTEAKTYAFGPQGSTGNYLQFNASTTGNPIRIFAAGTDATIPIRFEDKAGAGVQFISNGLLAASFLNAGTTVNFPIFSGGTAGNPVKITAYGGGALTNLSLIGDAAGSVSAANLIATGSFTATGLVTNADLANPATTVNGQTCTLGSTCTVTAAPTGTASGDLGGSYPGPSVAKVNGVTLGTTAPGISSCGSGSPSVTTGSNNLAGQFTMGTGTPTACTITFDAGAPFANYAFCTIHPASSIAAAITVLPYISASSKTAFTITLAAGTSSGIFNYVCNGH